MSVFPGGYSDPSDKTQYGSATYPPPPQPAAYPPPAPQYGGPPQPQMVGFNQQQMGGFNQQQMGNLNQQQMVVVNQQQIAAATAAFALMMDPNNPTANEHPVQMQCPSCHAQITTNTNYEIGACTYLWCILMAFMGFILCCWIPFIMNCSKDVVHTCPSCRAVCGEFKRQQQRSVHHGGGMHRRRGRRGRRR